MRNNKLKNLLIILFLPLVGVPILFFTLQKKVIIHQTEKPAPSSQVTLNDAEFFFFGKDNEKQCLIITEEGKLFPKKNETECKNITCNLITTKNQITTIKAPRAKIDHTHETILLEDGVSTLFERKD